MYKIRIHFSHTKWFTIKYDCISQYHDFYLHTCRTAAQKAGDERHENKVKLLG